MKHFRALCALLTAAMAASFAGPAGALTGVSSWAEPDVVAATSAGLTPDTFAALSAKSSVSRAEFCAVALKLYEAERETQVPRTDQVYFDDCDDPDVNTAYEMDLISGRGSGVFAPEESVSRQDLCVILDSVREKCEVEKPETTVSADFFPDGGELRDYAVDATETMLSTGIIKGVETSLSNDPEQAGETVTLLEPQGTATREQALIMASRFLDTFDAEPLTPSDLMEDGALLAGADDPETEQPADEPDADEATDRAEEAEAEEPEEPEEAEEPEPDDDETLNLTMGEPVPVAGTVEEKMEEVFGAGGGYYTDQADAESHMVDVTVQVWSLLSSGQKTPAFKTITVNEAIADEVQAVFQEIFAGDEKFPIKDVGGYAWRSSEKSEHRQGTAIDINYMENMECTIDADGNVVRITTGTHWTPETDPYSIPAGGDVVRAFAAHGFAWGGDAWSSKRDYMHFSYFGT